jgi:protein TonB
MIFPSRLIMNERLFITLPASLLLWSLALALLSFALNHEVARPLEGHDILTVHLITAAPKPAAAEPVTPPPKPEVKKAEDKPIKVKKPLPKPAETKPAPQPQPNAASMPEQQVQEAKSDNHGAVVTYQPMPKIPDDLRREAFNTYAMARFHVGADGSATVELLTPSQNPRLNRLLLESLKTWRFTPATDNGKSVASTFDIRVRFAVE